MKTFWPFAKPAPTEVSRADHFGGLEFASLRTSHGTAVCAAAAEGLLTHETPSGPSNAHRILMVRLEGVPHYAFIVAIGESPVEIGMYGDKLRARVLSYRVRSCSGPPTIVLRHPLAEIYVAALPAEHGGSGPLVADRAAIGGWETFQQAGSDAGATLPADLYATLMSARPVLASGCSARTMLDWLAEASTRRLADIGQALLRLAPPDTIAAVGVALVEQPGLAHRIATAWNDNPWSGAVIAALADWTRARPLRSKIEVGTDLDIAAHAVALNRPCLELPLHLLAAARRHVEPARGIAIMATARNEGPFFLDWIAHHQALGVEHFFIYSSDDNDDGSDELLHRLADNGVITYLHNQTSPSVSRQIKAYNHAFLCVPEMLDYRWCATIDLDEYLMVDPAQFRSLTDFLELQESRGADAVSLNWLMYGPDGQSTFSDRPFAERLLRRHPSPNRHVKTLVRTNQAWGTLHHAPIWPDRVPAIALDALGQPHYVPGILGGIGAFRNAAETGPAWVNHYFLRSLPEIVMKYARSSADAGGSHELRFNAAFVSGLVEDIALRLVEDRTILAWSDAVSIRRDELRRLPGVDAAHVRCVEAFCAAANRLVRDIPDHAGELPEHAREAYLALVQASIAEGVARP